MLLLVYLIAGLLYKLIPKGCTEHAENDSNLLFLLGNGGEIQYFREEVRNTEFGDLGILRPSQGVICPTFLNLGGSDRTPRIAPEIRAFGE